MIQDIVGTLSQPQIAFYFLAPFILLGVIGKLVKLLLSPNEKVTLVIGDLLITLLLGVQYIILSFFFSLGVPYLYTLLPSLLGFIIGYALTTTLIKGLKKLIFSHKKGVNEH